MSTPHHVSRMIIEAQCQNGSSVSRLLETYRYYLRLLARMQLNNELRGRVSPSDIVQDSLVTANHAFAGFRGTTEAELLEWLRKILATRLIDAHRFHTAQRRDARLDASLDQDVDQSSMALGRILSQQHESPSQSAVRREHAVILAEALQRLPTEYAEVIVQHHLEGRTFAEIADQSSRTVPSVKGIWARAMARLRSELRESI